MVITMAHYNVQHRFRLNYFCIIAFSSLFLATEAFTPQIFHTRDANVGNYKYEYNYHHHINKRAASSETELRCICINCSRVTDCAAYHFVESKHAQPHINNDPAFTPKDGSPTIHVNIRTNRQNEGEMGRLWSEHVEETRKAEERAASFATAGDDDEGSSQQERLVGEEKYDLSVKTTYEYDVVACEDFVKDDGCWVRNMPEEIKLANPDFVPT